MINKPYRSCILAVFINAKKKVLVGQRSDLKNWQFPQGGVDKGETEKQALFREMKEEIGSDQFSIISQAPKLVSYKFPLDLKAPITKRFIGQEQRWFLCQFDKGFSFDLKKASSPEFTALEWVDLDFVFSNIVSWKQEAYQQGLKLLQLK
ncbi:MAG: RNA pyrophosphohydrolase [Zetaproteobacteria bacterium]|nr:RNA pyrophosphohydrolase [Pseudobdellovibrionaceae bacterium]